MTTQESKPINIPETQNANKDRHQPVTDSESNSPTDTPRSYDSSDSSSLISTPRNRLLWDHGFDVSTSAITSCKTSDEREQEWRQFNKTDDDKLQADLMALGEKSLEQDDIVCFDIAKEEDSPSPRSYLSNDLPDLISSMSSSHGLQTGILIKTTKDGTAHTENTSNIQIDHTAQSSNSDTGFDNDITVGITLSTHNEGDLTLHIDKVDDDTPPPLPDSSPPALSRPDSPPPLPDSSPPLLDIEQDVVKQESMAAETILEVLTNKLNLTEDFFVAQNVSENIEIVHPVRDCDKFDNPDIKQATANFKADNVHEGNSALISHTKEKSIENEMYEVNSHLVEEVNKTSDASVFGEHTHEYGETGYQENCTYTLNDSQMHDYCDQEYSGKERFAIEAEKKFEAILLDTDDIEKQTDTKYTGENLQTMQDQIELFKDLLEKEQFDNEVEAEFEAIINALDLNYIDETYIERFADRRDRYGFILSPVVEAPSPTPSSLSGYSGLSSVSPDPLSMFRMSPRPGSRTDLDLSSLGIDPDEWDLNTDVTVPIYQTVQAKRAVVIPDSYGWDSGDDILSGSGEWESEDGALKSPPVSMSAVNLTQFGSHVVGWRQPDTAIIEESESSTAEESDNDSDDTIHGDSEGAGGFEHAQPCDSECDGVNQDCDSSDDNYGSENEDGSDNDDHRDNAAATDDDDNHNNNDGYVRIQIESKNTRELEKDLSSSPEDIDGEIPENVNNEHSRNLGILDEGIIAIENELADLRQQISLSTKHEINDKNGIANTNEENEDSLHTTVQIQNSVHEILNVEANVPDKYANYVRTNSNLSNQTADTRTSSDNDEDAEDEMSDTDQSDAYASKDDEDSDTEYFHNNRESLERSLTLSRDETGDNQNDETVQVSEILSPRTAILRAGGMFPLNDSDSSPVTTDSDVESYTIEDEHVQDKTVFSGQSLDKVVHLGVHVTQYTSDDSDVAERHGGNVDSSLKLKTNSIVSFRGKYKLQLQSDSPCAEDSQTPPADSNISSNGSTPTVQVISPMDFSIFGDKLDRASKNEGGRSPRVLGRYFAEMDEEVLAKSLSPPVSEIKIHDIWPSDGDGEVTEGKVSRFQKDDEVDFDESFRNVTFTQPENNNHVPYNNIDSEDNSSDSSELVNSDTENDIKTEDKQKDDKLKELENTSANNFQNSLITMPQTPGKDRRKTPPVTQSISKRYAKSQRKSPVQIKISHLKRKGSFRNKVKSGFVKQLSELFTKKQSGDNQEMEVQIEKRKPKASRNAEVRLPELLTPNENIVICPRQVQNYDAVEAGDTEKYQNSSLGFEVSPLQVMTETEKHNTEPLRDRHGVNTDTFFNIGSTISMDTLRAEDEDLNVKLYEERLRQIEEQSLVPQTVIDHGIDNNFTDTYQGFEEIHLDPTSEMDPRNNSKDALLKEYFQDSDDIIPVSKIIETDTSCQKENSALYDDSDDNEYIKNMNLFKKWTSKSLKNIDKITEDIDDNMTTVNQLSVNRFPAKQVPEDIPKIIETNNESSSLVQSEAGKGCQSLGEARQANRRDECVLDEQILDPLVDHSSTEAISKVTEEQNEVHVKNNQAEFTLSGEMVDNSIQLKQIPVRKRSFLQERKAMLSKMDFSNTEENVQYPASLSRRLYGPFVRQQLRSPQPPEELLCDYGQRENTHTTLSNTTDILKSAIERSNCQTADASKAIRVSGKDPFMKFPLHSDTQPDKLNTQSHQTGQRSSQCVHCLEDRFRARIIIHDHSQLDSDTKLNRPGESEYVTLNTDIFQHTVYKVDTPYTKEPSHKDETFHSKPITNCVGNEANRLYHRGNNFANANIRSAVRPQAVNTDANGDKIKLDFCNPSYLGDVKSKDLPVLSLSDTSSGPTNSENSSGVFTCDSGENIYTELKNGIFQGEMGVFPTTKSGVSDDKVARTKMKEDSTLIQATTDKGKASSLAINDPTSTTTVAVNQAYMSTGKDLSQGEGHRSEVEKNVPAGWSRNNQVSVVVLPPDCQHVLEDEKGNLKVWPYSEFDNGDRLPVTLHKRKHRVKFSPSVGMNDNSSNMTIIQSAQHSTEMPENRMVKKYHTSSVMPTGNSDNSIMQTHSDSVKTVLLQDANGNMVSEEELAKILPKIADSVAKMETSDAEEILPGITQSVTKLRNGGNLVITTMTRKLDEIESDSSGRGSPEPAHPVLNVDDLDNSKIYLVEDSKGELFYVEDITSESQESAYYSSSRNTSGSISDGASSPGYKSISKIHQVGDSGIHSSTAEEIISAMYDKGAVQEFTENEEEWSERTYEYDLPRRQTDGRTNGYSKDNFKTSYVVEEPDTMPRSKTTTKDTFESFYEMAEKEPWVADGGQMQSYSTQLVGVDRTDGTSAVDNADNYSLRMGNSMQTRGVTQPGYTTSQEKYTVEAEAQLFPMVPFQYPVVQPPVFVPPPPVCVPAENPQYSLVKVDVKPPVEESVTSRVDVTQHNKVIEIDERPIFKTVAHIQTGEKQPPVKQEMEKKKYKIISSKASPVKEEEQESHMSFGEVDYRFTTENVEFKQSPTIQTKQTFVRDSTRLEQQKLDSDRTFRSEKRINLGRASDTKSNTTTIEVKNTVPTNDVETYEERTYSFDQMKASVEPVLGPSASDMRVIRGSYLIKNNLEEVDGTLDDNINLFSGHFGLSKENPLYQSDEDLYRKFEREKAEQAQKQDRFQRDFNQDLTFETVDRFSKSKNVKREEVKSKKSVTELLLEKLSTIDSKDIRQRIDVKHHAEDLYGDPRFLHADGTSVRSQGTNDFDTVGEKVDLVLKEGKAFITVTVTAERITPVDMEFNVWRKNQAIVTRVIEVDLLATEQRRRLYYKVMDEQTGSQRGSGGWRDYRTGSNETILDSHQTLDLFSRILGAADGEGDKEDITVKTKLTNTTRPFSSGMDLLY